MSTILELMTFFAICLSSTFHILDTTYLGDYSMLSIICGMGYIIITLDGIFSLIDIKKNTEVD